MSNIVFYSRHCRLSTDLLRILENEKMIGYFKLICVDHDLENAPVRMVPTMIVKGVPKRLEGTETLEWVQQAKFITQRRLQSMKQQMVTHNMMKMMMQNQKKGPTGYSNEMKGLSDDFAYVTVDKALPHEYFGYKDEDQHAIFTAPEIDQKMTDDQIRRTTDLVDRSRAQQDQQIQERMKKQQLMEMIKHDREARAQPDVSEMQQESYRKQKEEIARRQRRGGR